MAETTVRGHKEQFFTITKDTLGQQSEKIKNELTAMKARKREITTTLLLLEEIAVRCQKNGNHIVTAKMHQFLGTIQIQLFSQGKSYNPIAENSIWDADSEEYIRNTIFRAYKENLSYTRRGEQNIITIRVHGISEHRTMFYTFLSMVLGIVAGFFMHLLPDNAASYIADTVLSTVQTLFMNTLFLLTAPIAFFSVTTSLADFSGSSRIKNTGGKVLLFFVLSTSIAIILGFFLAHTFFQGNSIDSVRFSPLSAPNVIADDVAHFENILIDIIPINLFQPVLNGNMMQLLLVSFLIGCAMSYLGSKVDLTRELFDNGKQIFSVLMGKLMTFMPLVAFASLAKFIYKDAGMIRVLFLYFAVVLLGCIILFFIYNLIILIFGRLSPIPYMKKSFHYFLVPFTVSDRYAILSQTVDFCKKKFGIPAHEATFIASIGAALNIAADSMCVIVQVLLLSRLCSVEIDKAIALKIGITTLLLSFGSNGFVCLMAILSIAGIPFSLTTLVIGVESILDRFRTVTNTQGDIAAGIIVAKSEKTLDEALYNAY